ncbi:3-(cis-5,6-dihydroxycyclohexa-1,3-dien-1-yl)propanoate dehydrogenase [Amycolatopsis rhabdoformis]|uniref:3-(Cis-5,6-dihydroxycyclohexa-1, 3-dien-1-yl)propanoate dehydrogenase n=1 Tax=Amycolatopsis rhabdoformis TaxID=1448059 RepID=A0ABZ1IK84_9PSEU|nr:3-(cis-5,6-dihydroxycyclohexa-1,3-dien-1-yl)propanoate dehydrogenase [Amycolatopsis rhabdoformis]WSE34580.1 3-(cis-5,6-dihydroxycyclohexa-1,3-dien-1-yl)propanoate dehydrogenase [Amycolatopsis rhabdoformis]
MTSPWLQGVCAIVTGAASGLGRAISRRFVAEGACVVAFDRSESGLAELKNELGAAAETVVGDVTSTADNRAAVITALTTFGSLDVFVGNAGIWDFQRSLEETDANELATAFDELFAVNVKGYLLGARAAVGALRASGGSMIFTLSNASFYPAGGGSLYTASKHAGLGLVRQLAYELAPAVRVNAVAPGGMATGLSGPAAMGLRDESISASFPIDDIMRRHGALRRAATPEDYVGAYVLLASKQSLTATGSVIDLSSVGTPSRPEKTSPDNREG